MIKNFSSYLFDKSQVYDDCVIYFQNNFKSIVNEFKTKCLKSAKSLEKCGLGPGKRVLVLMTDMVETSAVFHSLIHLGIEIVFVHHQTKIEDIANICKDLGCDATLSDNPRLSQITGTVSNVIGLQEICNFRNGSLDTVHEYQDNDVVVQYVIQGRDNQYHVTKFTHKDFVDAIKSVDQLGIPARSQVLSTINVSYPLGTMTTIIAPFLIGTSNALTGFVPDLSRINTTIDSYKIDTLITTPYVIGQMLRYSNTDMEQKLDRIFITSETLPNSHRTAWLKKVPVPLINLFSTSNRLLPLFVPDQTVHMALGLPNLDVEVQVVNQSGDPADINEIGMLEFRSQDSTSWKKLPDYAYRDHLNHYHYVARDSQFNFEINCSDIEDKLLSLPNVEDCQVRLNRNMGITIEIETKIGSDITIPDLERFINYSASWIMVTKIPRTNDKRKFDFIISHE